MSARRLEAVASALGRNVRPRAITTSLMRAQMSSVAAHERDRNVPVQIYFIDPTNFSACYRNVLRAIGKAKREAQKRLRGVLRIGNADAEILGQLDTVIEGGWRAFDNPNGDPIKAAAGIRAVIEALKMKGRMLGVNIDGRFETAGDMSNPATMAARKIAVAAKELRAQLSELAEQRRLKAPANQVIDVGSTSDETASN